MTVNLWLLKIQDTNARYVRPFMDGLRINALESDTKGQDFISDYRVQKLINRHGRGQLPNTDTYRFT